MKRTDVSFFETCIKLEQITKGASLRLYSAHYPQITHPVTIQDEPQICEGQVTFLAVHRGEIWEATFDPKNKELVLTQSLHYHSGADENYLWGV